MNILITGGSGYIATSLYGELNQHHNVTSITRQTFDLTNVSSTKQWFADKHFDVVIHTAISGGSRLHNDTFETLDNNLRMYYNLLENKNHFNKFISIGSGAELYQTDTPYGLSKHVIRQSMLEKPNFYNLRVFAVFDENELPTRFIKANIIQYIDRQPLTVFNDKRMDFFYMKDFVRLVMHYVNGVDLPKEYDCTYDTSYFLTDIAEIINSLGSHRTEIVLASNAPVSDYIGTHVNIGIPFDGLHHGIRTVFERLSCKK